MYLEGQPHHLVLLLQDMARVALDNLDALLKMGFGFFQLFECMLELLQVFLEFEMLLELVADVLKFYLRFLELLVRMQVEQEVEALFFNLLILLVDG